MAIKSDTSKRLGALLLKGWAMLAENCPDCQVPLMKERSSEERLCVNCETTFAVDAQGLRPTNRNGDSESSHQAASREDQHHHEAEAEAHGNEHDADISDPHTDPRLGPFAARSALRDTDAGITAGAEAAATCNGSHVVELSARGRENGCSSSRAGDAYANGGPAGGSHGNGIAGRQVGSAASADDVADLLSAKMLQGWALLDKYCPRCSTVLVRSKATKRMFCVACDAWVVTEADSQKQGEPSQQPPRPPQQQQPPPQQQQAPPSSSHGGAVAPAAAPRRNGQEGSHTAHPRTAPPPVAPPSPPQREPQQGAGGSVRPEPAEASTAPKLPALLVSPTATVAAQLERSWGPFAQQLAQQAHATAAAGRDSEGGGAAPCSRGSSPPAVLLNSPSGLSMDAGALPAVYKSASAPSSQQQEQQPHAQQTSRPGQSTGSQEGGGAGKQPPGTALLMNIRRTVVLKMAEAQSLLERTPAVDTEKTRSYVSLINECLDLLAKLHSLQQ